MRSGNLICTFVALLAWPATLTKALENTKQAFSQEVSSLFSVISVILLYVTYIHFASKKASKVEDVLHTTGEVWLGLDKLHKLTSKGDYGLRITMTDFDAKRYMAVYDQFQVVFIFCVEYTIESIEDSGLYEIEQLGEVGKKMAFAPPLIKD